MDIMINDAIKIFLDFRDLFGDVEAENLFTALRFYKTEEYPLDPSQQIKQVLEEIKKISYYVPKVKIDEFYRTLIEQIGYILIQ